MKRVYHERNADCNSPIETRLDEGPMAVCYCLSVIKSPNQNQGRIQDFVEGGGARVQTVMLPLVFPAFVILLSIVKWAGTFDRTKQGEIKGAFRSHHHGLALSPAQ
ncbi:hypothetical protein M8J77_009496 [Diaphorina citri]|nr:hypothetical protein M8J77_009496 [Diaphorina citri]